MVSMSQFNWEGIELGGVRSAWLYLVLNPIIHTQTHTHTRHASGATECNLRRQRRLLGTQEVFDKRYPPPPRLSHRPPTPCIASFPYGECGTSRCCSRFADRGQTESLSAVDRKVSATRCCAERRCLFFQQLRAEQRESVRGTWGGNRGTGGKIKAGESGTPALLSRRVRV